MDINITFKNTNSLLIPDFIKSQQEKELYRALISGDKKQIFRVLLISQNQSELDQIAQNIFKAINSSDQKTLEESFLNVKNIYAKTKNIDQMLSEKMFLRGSRKEALDNVQIFVESGGTLRELAGLFEMSLSTANQKQLEIALQRFCYALNLYHSSSKDNLEQRISNEFQKLTSESDYKEVENLILYTCNCDSNCTLLTAATLIDSVPLAEYALTRGVSINDKDPVALETPLSLATKNGSTSLVEHLLEQGADWKEAASNGALDEAIRQDNVKIVELFMKKGADPKVALAISFLTTSPETQQYLINITHPSFQEIQAIMKQSGSSSWENFLNIAFKRKEMDWLEKSLEENQSSPEFCQLFLNKALTHQNWELVKKVIQQEAFTPSHIKRYSIYPIHLATLNHDLGMVKYLLDQKKDDVNAVDQKGNSALHYAVITHDIKMVELLLSYRPFAYGKNSNHQSPLQLALNEYQWEIIKRIIESGIPCDFSIHNNEKITILHMAAANGDLDIVKKLVENGVPLNERTKLGKLPLEYAKKSQRQDIVDYLIGQGADTDLDGNTYLQKMILAGEREIVIEQIKKGSNLNLANAKDDVPLQTALRMQDYEIAELLIKHGAEVNVSFGNRSLLSRVLIDPAITNKREALEFLFKNGADLNFNDQAGYHPLGYVFTDDKEISDWLIDRGADPNDFGYSGVTPTLLAKMFNPEVLIDHPENKGLNDEIILLKLITNIWSLNHDISLDFKGTKHIFEPSGFYNYLSNFTMGMLLNRFQSLYHDQDLADTQQILRDKIDNMDLPAQELLKDFKNGKDILFDSGWSSGHITNLILFQDYLIQINRGEMKRNGGIIAKKLNRESATSTKEDFSKIQMAYTKEGWGDLNQKQYWHEGLFKNLAAEEEDIICKVLNKQILSDQKMGNCWWLSPKTSILIILALKKMKKVTLDPSWSESQKLEAYEKAYTQAYNLYQKFSHFVRFEILREYLDNKMDELEKTGTNQFPPNQEVIVNVLEKMLKKKWKVPFDPTDLIQTLEKFHIKYPQYKMDSYIPKIKQISILTN